MQKNRLHFVIIYSSFVALIFLIMLARYEPGGESWGFWFFTRLLNERLEFPLLGRSPLYVLYLQLFYWIGYPYSVLVEWAVTSLIVAIALWTFLSLFIDSGNSFFATALWLPFIRMSPPSTQGLGLACICIAFVIRERDDINNRLKYSLSYALMIFAYLFRPTFIVLICVFILWDLLELYKKGGFNTIFATMRPRIKNWPLVIPIILIVVFSMLQSNHLWNNAYIASTEWFPNDGKSLKDASFIQAFSWHYILLQYGSFVGQDFYYTNKELFSGANTMWDAILANPEFVIKQWLANIKSIINQSTHLVFLRSLFSMFPRFLSVPFVLLITCYGVFRLTVLRKSSLVFIIACVLVTGTMVVSIPKTRYLVTLTPIFILSAVWYGLQFKNFSLKFSKIFLRRFVSMLAIPICLLLFSNLKVWKGIANNVLEYKNYRLMEGNEFSLHSSYKTLSILSSQCIGMLTLEHIFFGAYINYPIDRIYDVFEIPPFGHFQDSEYNGLFPERIDCIFVSNTLATSIGMGTNSQIRYKNYIQPYIKHLTTLGATTCNVPKYGKVVLLNVPPEGRHLCLP